MEPTMRQRLARNMIELATMHGREIARDCPWKTSDALHSAGLAVLGLAIDRGTLQTSRQRWAWIDAFDALSSRAFVRAATRRAVDARLAGDIDRALRCERLRDDRFRWAPTAVERGVLESIALAEETR